MHICELHPRNCKGFQSSIEGRKVCEIVGNVKQTSNKFFTNLKDYVKLKIENCPGSVVKEVPSQQWVWLL